MSTAQGLGEEVLPPTSPRAGRGYIVKNVIDLLKHFTRSGGGEREVMEILGEDGQEPQSPQLRGGPSLSRGRLRTRDSSPAHP